MDTFKLVAPKAISIANCDAELTSLNEISMTFLDQSTIARQLINVIELQGIPYVGKSTFLNFFKSQTKIQENFLTAFVTLNNKFDEYSCMERMIDSIESEMKRFNFSYMPAEFSLAKQQIIEIQTNKKPDTVMKNIIQYFISGLVYIKNKTNKAISLIFDQVEQAPEMLKSWIEKSLFARLAYRRDLCICIWSSRDEWDWSRPEIRIHYKKIILTPFGGESEGSQAIAQQSVRQLIQIKLIEQGRPLLSNLEGHHSLLLDVLSKIAFELTWGHPYAVEIIVNSFTNFEDVNLNPERITQQMKMWVKAIYQEFILKIFNELDISQSYLAAAVGLTRGFHVEEIKILQNAFSLTKAKDSEISTLIKKLGEASFVNWDRSLGLFCLNHYLRYIVRRYFDLHVDKNEQIFFHMKMQSHYKDRPNSYEGNYIANYIEQVYHLLEKERLLTLESTLDVEKGKQVLKDFLKSNFVEWGDRDLDPNKFINEIDERLKKDFDLKNIWLKVRHYIINSPEIKKLVNDIRSRKDNLQNKLEPSLVNI